MAQIIGSLPSRKPSFFRSQGTHTKIICVTLSLVLVSVWPFNPLITLKEEKRRIYLTSPHQWKQAAFLGETHHVKTRLKKAEPLQSLCKTLPGKTDLQDLKAGKGKKNQIVSSFFPSVLLSLWFVMLQITQVMTSTQVVSHSCYCHSIFLTGFFFQLITFFLFFHSYYSTCHINEGPQFLALRFTYWNTI